MADEEQDIVHQPFHREGDAFVLDAPPDPQEAARQRRENEQHEFARSQVKTNRRLAWFTCALVVATFFTIAVGIWQGTISQKAANAARDAVAVASKTLTETQTSNARQAALEIQDRANAQIEAAKSLQSTIDNFHNDERAWLGATDYFPTVVSAQDHTPIGVDVKFINSGRTPATNFRAYVDYAATLDGVPKYDKDPANTDPKMSRQTIFPNGTGHIRPHLPSSDIDAINGGAEGGYVFGTVWYSDVFGTAHWSQYCAHITPRFNEFVGCSTHSLSDTDKARK